MLDGIVGQYDPVSTTDHVGHVVVDKVLELEGALMATTFGGHGADGR